MDPAAKKRVMTVGWLGVFLVLALALRIIFSVGVAFDDGTQRYLYSGNDPYYHHRTVDHILDTGESLLFDPAINYPDGGRNPNPPLFDWTSAVDAKFAEMAGAEDPVGLALNLAVAVWGALTIIPVFMIASDLWGRRAGLWAAFFMAVSAPHIQRSVFGFADHDATTMFWIVLSFAFLVKAMKTLKHKEYVPSWKDGALAGIRAGLADNRVAVLWSVLAGVAMAGTALTWKGYPYALAIMAVALGLQLLLDHARNRDSTVVAALYLMPVVLTLLISWPYYAELGLVRSTVTPNLYVLAGMLLVTLVLVPTRDLPSVLVFPAVFLGGVAGLLILAFAVPQIGNMVFTGLGYFRQTKLYSTIAEAQRSELGFVAANFGFFLFLLAVWAYARTLRRAWRGEATMVLMASWATVAAVLAFAASRFVMHAAPVFIILGGAATSWIIAKAGFDEVAKRRRQRHGQGTAVGGAVKSMTGKSVGFALVVGLFLVLPNVWLGVDAAMPGEFENENQLSQKRFGAFGIGFDVGSSGWLDLFSHLAERDTQLALADRPAFIAWWDYGHWATAIGLHPTVADPFQNHFELAGRFLAAETESNAMKYLCILLVDGEARSGGVTADTAAVLAAYGLDAADIRGTYDEKFGRLEAIDDQEVFALYNDLMDATGDEVAYFGVDSRMFPISVQQSGIFYAPVYLANKNPDDFVKIVYQGQGVQLEVIQYEMDDNGDSIRLNEPRFADQNGDPWVVTGGQAFRGTRVPLNADTPGVAVQPVLETTDRFDTAMYTRAFGSLDPAVAPGDGLTHWRAIHETTTTQRGVQGNDITFRTTALLQYYRGHTIAGTLVDDTGAPLEDLTVTFVDAFGAAHGTALTDGSGAFEVLAPFGPDLALTVLHGGVAIHSQPWDQPVSADGGRTDGVRIEVARGSIQGRAFEDHDANGVYDEGTDTPVAGAAVAHGGLSATTAADGTFSFVDVPAGSDRVTVTKAGYEPAGQFVTVRAGESADAPVFMAPLRSDAVLTFLDDGQPVAGVPLRLEGPRTVTVTTSVNGSAETQLPPGEYQLIVDHTVTRAGIEVVYDERRSFTVPFGGEAFTFTLDV